MVSLTDTDDRVRREIENLVCVRYIPGKRKMKGEPR